MKKRIVFSLSLVFLVLTACNEKGTKLTTLDNRSDSIGYAVGIDLARMLEQHGLDTMANTDILLASMANAIAKDTANPLMDMNYSSMFIQQVLMEEQKKANDKKFAKNKTAGKEFLESNKMREEVIETESGLQYEVLVEGNGSKPAATDQVSVHYHGTLIDGRVFDSSKERGEPATFRVNAVIPGWTEALQMMPVGSKWKLYIPSELAYGERPMQGSIIEPYSTLIFEVELLEIK